MKKVKIALLIVSALLILLNLLSIDFNNSSWTNNRSSYLGILSMIALVASLWISIYSDKAKHKS